ncbi:sulfite exporter TauE/SafE family protein [Methanoplanus endosymbiosus]|uniref:Probable membrane transporter protein n=1 Tax=Methanoplanus endosymbiosus TaxID=33865 RepID=A0A9E7PLY2_9EURY|nr:sulfite exporter TauE/SafE family protein [Methanoplanus endosymbiosus]UUX92583.1 sulfite exporter TauE/SafE family protein [Methanoplanus endosymbiosus]
MEMELIYILALLFTGIIVGFAGGLLGVGGCFIMIPVQYWVLTSMGYDPQISILVAFGTNLAVVLPTALSGAYGHNKKGAVMWNAAVTMGIAGFFGAIIGGYIATLIPGDYLKVIFGVVILLSAVRMLTAKPPKLDKSPVNDTLTFLLWGIPIGLLSGIIGIGGGVVLIPVMVLALHFKMHSAVGTSTALMAFTALGGTIAYVINGFGVIGLPEYSLGYLNLLQWILLAVPSVIMAQVGVRVAHKLPAKQLKYVFIAVMIYMGLKMAGVFTFLGLPL